SVERTRPNENGGAAVAAARFAATAKEAPAEAAAERRAGGAHRSLFGLVLAAGSLAVILRQRLGWLERVV
ncbi:MAG TPA: hypothetical protein VHG51_09985, partial [Longimicrobiaceae bacterium]|nr:hypothetical protein [Longimicrobiaceae bacterium]